jgi:serine phosphatase RsbU (regulator of sigma subunit)
MSQAGFDGAVATALVDARVSAQPDRDGTLAELEQSEIKLASLKRDLAELHTAIFEAAQVHRRLCAPRLIRRGDFEVASEIFAVRHLPGDFFTVYEKRTELILALGDIAGKGLAAGMWTTHLVGLVGAHSETVSDPEVIIAGVNRDLCRMALAAPLASLFLARLDPNTGRLDYCSAGHPPAMLLRSNNELELLSEGGLLLGVSSTAAYTRGSVELGENDVLIVYSDGIHETRNRAEKEFGYERLEAQLRRSANSSAEAVLFSVLGAVQDFAASAPLVDDTSLVVVRRSRPRPKQMH